MTFKHYLNFDLLLEGSEGQYLARVIDSPAGQAKNQFGLLFQPGQLDLLLERISFADGEAAAELGKGLFDAIYDSGLQSLFNRSLDEAERQGKGLRIRLRLSDAPDLINLPWEYLYDPAFQRFLALSVDTPIVRFLDLPERERALAVAPPLRIMVMISSPDGYPALDVEAEWSRLKGALAPLEEKKLIVVERLDQATLPILQQRLRQYNYHIFHFIGHGAVDENKKTGSLVFETDQGGGTFADSRQLSTLFFDEKSIRLVVLNACQGGQTWSNNPFGGVAQGLIQQGVPAVVAMQYPISDQAAIAFSTSFYSALADYYPVDAAIGEARKAMFLEGNAVEWATPVLYLRAANAFIFGAPAEIGAEVAGTVKTPEASPEEVDEKHIVATSKKEHLESSGEGDLSLPGKWLFVNEFNEELTVEFAAAQPAANSGSYSASLYYKRSKNWVDEAIEGQWTYDPAKDRLALRGSFVEYDDRFSLTLVLGRENAGFITAKDSEGARYSLIRVTGEFRPEGKWLITYDLNGPCELNIEFLPAAGTDASGGEFTATENFKEGKRWVAEDVYGQWAFDPAKKRLSLNGKYAGTGARFSLTPYISRWDKNHFTAKDHDGIEFYLSRVG